jgi:O-antigen ligase
MTNGIQQNIQRIAGSLLIAAVFFIPLVPLVAKLCSGLALILLCIRAPRDFASIHPKDNKAASALILLFFLYVGSVLFSVNTSAAWKDVVSKTPFVIIPVLFYLLPANPSRKNTFLCSFALGTGLLCLVLLVRAILNYGSTGAPYVFFYEAFAWNMHPTYLALYISFSLLVLFHFVHETGRNEKGWQPVVSGALYCLGASVLILSSSRMGIIAGAAAAVLYLGHLYFQKKSVSMGRLAFYIFTFPLLFLLLNYGLNSASRFGEVKKYVNTGAQTDHGSIAARVKIWESSGELIRENFWTGTGTGDVQDELRKLYERNDLQYALSKNLNAHNQFLQTLLATGIAGLLVLLALFFLPLVKCWREKQFLELSFLLVVAFNSLTEAILEREAGVLWFSVFYGLFFCTGSVDKRGLPEQ